MVEVDISKIDVDGLILNTPKGTVDLRTGELKPHNPLYYCTKITKVSPSDNGADLWRDFIDKFTQGDKKLEKFLQITSGIEIIGKVYSENADW